VTDKDSNESEEQPAKPLLSVTKREPERRVAPIKKDKEFLKSQAPKVFVVLAIASILLVIMGLSAIITPDRENINSPNVIGFTFEHLLINILVICLTIVVILYFTRLIFVEQSEEFVVDTGARVRNTLFVILIIVFLSAVLVLLDTALINIYVSLPQVTLIWYLNLNYAISTDIPTTTDLVSYANIRGKIFSVLLGFIMIFPIATFILILSRIGRKKLFQFQGTNLQFYVKSFEIWVYLLLILSSLILFTVLFQDPSQLISALIVVIIFDLIGITAFFLFILVIEIMRRVLHVTSSYILMIVPIILLFYIIPVIMWSVWDTVIVLVEGDLSSTIYRTNPEFYQEGLKDRPIELIFYHIGINFGQFNRILELDFVIIIGIAAVIIGFAEGYALYTIIFGITRGRALSRSGRYFSGRTSSSGAIRFTRLIFLFAWTSLVWDKALKLLQFARDRLLIDIPFNIDLPTVFTILTDITYHIDFSNQFLVPLSILLIPALIIITSSFKFLSVSLIIEKTKNDTQMFFLFITSTFILIIAKIFADISSSRIFEDPTYNFLLPLSSLTGSSFIPFVINVFAVLEAIAFYTGLTVVLFHIITGRMRRQASEI
jgi:hypothetical protein